MASFRIMTEGEVIGTSVLRSASGVPVTIHAERISRQAFSLSEDATRDYSVGELYRGYGEALGQRLNR
jgi:hypothetical protein